MQTTSRNLFSLVVGLATSSASAAVSIDWVTVGDAGNAAHYTTSLGAVAYNYRIARNETTGGQYVEFLNATAKTDPYQLYSTSMASQLSSAGITRTGSSGDYSYSVIASHANKPITYVSWFDAARFCNWLHNGQGSGSTETGAYTLNGAMSGVHFTVNPGARTWIPSPNEWYKAAYYDPTKGGNGGYWRFPIQSDAPGGNTIGVPNSANYFDGNYVSDSWRLTNVGAYGANSDSFYGTNDQGGNVAEWSDSVTSSFRRVFGGSWADNDIRMSTTSMFYASPTSEYGIYGFRVASVPEPASKVLTMMFGGMLLTRRKR